MYTDEQKKQQIDRIQKLLVEKFEQIKTKITTNEDGRDLDGQIQMLKYIGHRFNDCLYC